MSGTAPPARREQGERQVQAGAAAQIEAEQPLAPDTGERGSWVGGATLYRSPVRLRPGVPAPRQAWRLLPGESPGRVRVSHPPVLSVGPIAELGNRRTRRWGKRTQRIL